MSGATPTKGRASASTDELRVLLSNVAYGRGLTGSFSDQVFRAYRHFYTRPSVRAGVVDEIRRLIDTTKPHVVGFIEVDRRLASGPSLDRLISVLEPSHPHGDVANKYFRHARGRFVPLLGRNCNAFCSTLPVEFERVYLPNGMKRLVHKITLGPALTLFFAHLSLRRAVRARQIADIGALVRDTPGEHVVMGDFNIFGGFDELKPLLDATPLVLLNDHGMTTHRFHRTRRVLDVGLCSPRLREHAALDVIEQGYSDHAALLLTLDGVALHPKRRAP